MGFNMKEYVSSVFQPFSFKKGITLRNRIIMAPMTTWSATSDGNISEQELAFYRSRGNAVGMVVTGCTSVMANGIGFMNEFSAYDDCFIPSLTNLAQYAKNGGAMAILQIFHAGNKAIPELVPNADVVSASTSQARPGPFNDGNTISRAMTEKEITEVILAFGETTRRAIEAGFDGVEIHGAHGFLLQNFLSPHYNQRTDQWGGSLENRMRFPLEVIQEVQRVIKQYAKTPFLLGYRISPEEAEATGLRIHETYKFLDKLIDHEIDYIHASLFNISEAKPIDSTDEETIAQLIVKHVNQRVPVIAAGSINSFEQANHAMSLGLSLVAVGRGLVINPNWVELAQAGQGEQIENVVQESKVSQLYIPDGLWNMMKITQGWFSIQNN